MRRANAAARGLALGSIVLIVSAMLLASPNPGSVGLHPSAAPPSTFRIGNTQEPDSMNPFVGTLTASYAIYASVYDLLIGVGEDLTPVPQLAKNWSVSADGLTWTFNLYPGVVWHDHTNLTPRPFTSLDVKFTYEYVQTCRLSAFLAYVGDPTDPTAAYIRQITTPTPTQVVITTNKPKANMLSLVVPILPQHIWNPVSCAQAKQGFKNEPPIGTGMYRFVEWRKGQFLRLALHPQYHFLQAGRDYVDEIIYRFFNTANAVLTDFRAGNLDATSALLPQQFLSLPADIDGGTANPDADPDPDITKFVQDSLAITMQGFCSATDSLISTYGVSGDRHWLSLNLTIRQAAANAVNKTQLIDTIWSGLDAMTGQPRNLARAGSTQVPYSTPFWHYNVTAQEELRYSIAQGAARLSDPAGDGYTTTDGNPPNLLGSNLNPTAPNNRDAFADLDGDGVRDVIDRAYVAARNPQAAPQANRAVRGSGVDRLLFGLWIISTDQEAIDAANLFIPDLNRIGIGIEVRTVSSAQQLAASLACDYDWYMWGWGFDVDPDAALSVMTTDQILGWQDAWYSNATYDAWYLEQATKVDLYQRQAIVHAMQRLLYRDQPYDVLWYPKTFTVVRSDRFTNWGDWDAHAGLGLAGYGNVFTMLRLTPVFVTPNQCPTLVSIDAPIQPRLVVVGSTESFNGTAIDPEADALTWTWDWNDGNVTLASTGAGVGTNGATHAWTLPGDYNITLTVTDGLCGGSVTSTAVWVQVLSLPPPPGWIVGTVTDASSGLPIPGATVVIAPGGANATTALDGTYNLTVSPGFYTVFVSKVLYVDQNQTATVSSNAATTVDVSLQPVGGWIAGTVRDAWTGGAIAGALVTIMPGGASAFTAADGMYNVSVGVGSYTVTASDAQYFPTSNGTSVASATTTNVDFFLIPLAARIVGVVTDATTGAPIPGAAIAVSPGGTTTSTAADGSYNVTLAPGSYTVTASAALHGPQSLSASVASGTTTNLSFVLSLLPAYVAGVVTDAASGAPIAGATITVSPGGWTGTTAADGSYNITVAPGSYTVTASKALYVTGSSAVTLTSGATTTANLQLQPTPGWIAGTVADGSNGAPLVGVTLKAVDGSGVEYPGTTAADGTYNLTLPPGTYTVIVVQATGYVNQTRAGVVVASGQTRTVDFALTASGGRIVGRVTDATSGSPLAGVRLMAVDATGGEFSGVTMADGTYALAVPSGTYDVIVVLAPGYVNQTRTGLNVGDGQTVQVDFTLQPTPSSPPPGGIGAEALIAGGAMAAIVFAALAVLLLRRRKREEPARDAPRKTSATSQEPPPPPLAPAPVEPPPPPPPEPEPPDVAAPEGPLEKAPLPPPPPP